MRRRAYLTAGAVLVGSAIAGCLGDDEGVVLDLEPADGQIAASADLDLDAGDYELLVSFKSYSRQGAGIDEPYVHCAVRTADHEETLAEIELTEEGTTDLQPFTLEDDGAYVAVLQRPTTESSAHATVNRV